MSTSPVRVRFAPSPTGSLHIGGARSALFNWLFARHHGGAFVLRIEDTDRERSTKESETQVLEDLRWLGLEWDEGPGREGSHGPYRQSERTESYRRLAHSLIEQGKAYTCYCTDEELAERRERAQAEGGSPHYDGACRDLSEAERAERRGRGLPESARFRVPGRPVRVRDLIRGDVEFAGDVVGDFVILRSNGLPTYNFACVVDDEAMAISHVIRGEEHLSNTNRQLMLYEALGYDAPEFAHISLVLNPDRTKMSKRSGEAATFVEEFRNQGYVSEALVNYLVLLGWSWDDKTEIFSRDELVKKFSLDRVNPTAAIFDREKLEWMNGVYLRDMPLEERTKRVWEYLERCGTLPARPDLDEYLPRVVAAVGDRLKRLADVMEYAGFAFQDPVEVDPQAKAEVLEKDRSREALAALVEMVGAAEPFEPQALEPQARALAGQLEMKAGQLFFPARIALTGKKFAPGLFEVMELLGRQKTLERLRAAIDWFSEASSPREG